MALPFFILWVRGKSFPYWRVAFAKRQHQRAGVVADLR